MKIIRLIPRLDIKGPNLVKGIHLEGLRVLGKPWDYALKYYEDGADELIYIDAVASLYRRNNLLEIVRMTASKIFIPLTVGGGIRSVADIRELLRAGADKVAINTAAVENPGLIKEASEAFGSQCIVGSIQSKCIDGKYYAFTDNAREATDLEVLPWARKLVELGVGELLVTSIDQEGTGKGYELGLFKEISQAVPVPVIACGGCGRAEDMLEAVHNGGADAICASSVFHYRYIKEITQENDYKTEGNIEFIKMNRGSVEFMASRLKPLTIPEAKKYLTDNGINCRVTAVY